MRTRALVLLLAFPGVGFAEEERAPAPPPFVKTMVVPEGPRQVERQFFGRVAALDTVDLSFEVAGQLLKLDALEGTRISEGERLAALDLGPFQRTMERAAVDLEKAERDLSRASTLAERNVASTATMQDAETTRALADVALREAREALRDATILAPFDALIADRIASRFTTVEPGEAIVRVHNLSEVRVIFDLPERVLSQIGDPSAIAFTALVPGERDPVPLTFREFRVETGNIGQSYTLSLAVSGPAAQRLIPGQTAVVRAVVPAADPRPLLPPTAIATLPGGGAAVVIVEENGEGLVARHQPVEVAAPGGTQLAVSGVPPRAEIVAVGAHLIADGQAVARFTGLTVEGD